MGDTPKNFQVILYNTAEENISVHALLKDETIWLTQKSMAELFDCTKDNIGLHLKNIYNEGELLESATTEDFSVVQKEGSRNVNRVVKFYNLDAIISVGYRVNSSKATKFRMWATSILKASKEYDIFNKIQPIESDFDESIKEITQKMKEVEK